MRDGGTRRIATPEAADAFTLYMQSWEATIVIVSGDAAGTEFPLQRRTTSIGRGPDSDWAIEDDAMSREHAAVEFTGKGFRIRDLGSMNGVLVNGAEVKVAVLKHGDRFQLGEHVFQFLLAERPHEPKAYVLPDA
jgi:pSer/pThr/pTyr-binding forkhead associated (FHA) protein